MSGNTEKPLHERVGEWLAEVGFPLEFTVANHWRAAGFQVRQGEYVRGDDTEQPRGTEGDGDSHHVSRFLAGHLGHAGKRSARRRVMENGRIVTGYPTNVPRNP